MQTSIVSVAVKWYKLSVTFKTGLLDDNKVNSQKCYINKNVKFLTFIITWKNTDVQKMRYLFENLYYFTSIFILNSYRIIHYQSVFGFCFFSKYITANNAFISLAIFKRFTFCNSVHFGIISIKCILAHKTNPSKWVLAII